MTNPTEEQIRTYVAKLPDLYKKVLAAYPDIAPGRKHGDALASGSFVEYVVENHPDYHPDAVTGALERLVDRDFLEGNGIYYSPTPLGERLIEAVTGITARKGSVPDLPVPTWG